MDFSVGIMAAVGVLVAGILSMIAVDPGYLPEPVVPEPMMVVVEEEIPAGPQTHTVLMAEGSALVGCEVDNSCYIPYAVTILAGDTVAWDNVDDAAHTVTSITDGAPDGIFESGLVAPGGIFEFTFQEAGEYPYFCIVHPWMAGMVTVG